MCTVAWNVTEEGLWICFNRDESTTRSPAELPVVDTSGKFPVAYARDPDGGGTWLAVSGAGFIVALMNNYCKQATLSRELVSRGKLALALAGETSLAAARSKLQESVHGVGYAPFFLFLLGLREQYMYRWSGDSLAPNQPCPHFWTTSSHRTTEVVDRRNRDWAARTAGRVISPEDAMLILRERGAELAFGMTMDRQDARTVSQSAVWLTSTGMQFSYAERQIDGLDYNEPVTCRW